MFLTLSVLAKMWTSAKMPASKRPSGPSGSAIRPLPSVVPILAPMITEIAGRRPMTPALTRPTTMTVIAVEDWITPVMKVPAMTPLTGVPAILASSARILLTARFWMPLLMNSRPSMKMPRPPITGTITCVKISTCMLSTPTGVRGRVCGRVEASRRAAARWSGIGRACFSVPASPPG